MDLGKIGKKGLGNLGSGILGNHKKGGMPEDSDMGDHRGYKPGTHDNNIQPEKQKHTARAFSSALRLSTVSA